MSTHSENSRPEAAQLTPEEWSIFEKLCKRINGCLEGDNLSKEEQLEFKTRFVALTGLTREDTCFLPDSGHLTQDEWANFQSWCVKAADYLGVKELSAEQRLKFKKRFAHIDGLTREDAYFLAANVMLEKHNSLTDEVAQKLGKTLDREFQAKLLAALTREAQTQIPKIPINVRMPDDTAGSIQKELRELLHRAACRNRQMIWAIVVVGLMGLLLAFGGVAEAFWQSGFISARWQHREHLEAVQIEIQNKLSIYSADLANSAGKFPLAERQDLIKAVDDCKTTVENAVSAEMKFSDAKEPAWKWWWFFSAGVVLIFGLVLSMSCGWGIAREHYLGQNL